MPATMRPLTTQHPKIEKFLHLWHENGRAQFQRSMPSHNYDTEQRKTAKNRRQYLLLNSGNDRVFILATCRSHRRAFGCDSVMRISGSSRRSRCAAMMP